MARDFQLYGIDWKGGGYFGCPEPPEGMRLPDDLYSNPWLSWSVVLAEAKRGNFEHVPKLLDLYNYKDPVLRRLCYVLFGDAAPSSAFSSLIQQIESNKNIDRILYQCEALVFRGKLKDVPILLKAYLRNHEYQDSSIIPVRIMDLLGGETPQPKDAVSRDAFRDQTLGAFRELVGRFGTEEVLLFEGELLSVKGIAGTVLKALRKPFFDFEYRRRFEAMTGINCSSFYNDKKELQPLTASAVVEDFLGNAECERYQDGTRYFFGHQIPG